MKKSDLKSGMIVEIIEGYLYLVVDDILIRDVGYLNLSSYHDDLKHTLFRDFNIIKIYNYKLGRSFSRLLDDDNLELIWERKEHELTSHEIDVLKALQTLGYKWLARDKDDELIAHKNKPDKHNEIFWSSKLYLTTRVDKDLFPFIKWNDKEPTNIDELLK